MSEDLIDTRFLAGLIEASEDLNSDAVRITKEALSGFGGDSEWSRAVPVGGLAGVGTGSETAASTDVMALQTAASLENLAVSVYRTAAGLQFIRGGNKTVMVFIVKTAEQHRAHAKAFSAASTKAGGKRQKGVDPKYAAVVKKALPKIKNAAGVVKLALALENVAAQTYTRNVSQVSSAELRNLFGSIAPVEAQHRSVLLAAQALLAGAPELIAIPTDAAKLPAAAGSVGIPVAFYPTRLAVPVREGIVK